MSVNIKLTSHDMKNQKQYLKSVKIEGKYTDIEQLRKEVNKAINK